MKTTPYPGAPPTVARRSVGLMTAVSFGTGVLDAVTYLGMDGVFGANMTGNVIILGTSVSGAAHMPVLGPAAALGGFVGGSYAAGLLSRRVPVRPGERLTSRLFWGAAAGMAAVAVALAVLPHTSTVVHAVTLAIGLFVGMQAVAARRVGVPDMSTIVITSTLSLLFAEAGGFADRDAVRRAGRRALAVLSMFVGAAVGALLVPAGLWVGVAIAAAILLIAGTSLAAGSRAERTAAMNSRSELQDTH